MCKTGTHMLVSGSSFLFYGPWGEKTREFIVEAAAAKTTGKLSSYTGLYYVRRENPKGQKKKIQRELATAC